MMRFDPRLFEFCVNVFDGQIQKHGEPLRVIIAVKIPRHDTDFVSIRIASDDAAVAVDDFAALGIADLHGYIIVFR